MKITFFSVMFFERNVVRLPNVVFEGHVYPKVGRSPPPPPATQ